VLFHSRIPPMHLWPEIEREYRGQYLCIYDELPRRLFCGEPAVCLTAMGPRCEEHLDEVSWTRGLPRDGESDAV
jgi:hypothetical protein